MEGNVRLPMEFVLDEKVLAFNEDKLRESAVLNPEDPVSLSNLATYLSCSGEYEEARDLYRQARILAPNDYRIAYNFMVVLMKQLNFIDALRIAQDIDEPDELEPELSLQIGTCHLALKNYYEAVEHLSQAAKRLPDHKEVHYNLYKAASHSGLNEIAQKARSRYLTLAANDP